LPVDLSSFQHMRNQWIILLIDHNSLPLFKSRGNKQEILKENRYRPLSYGSSEAV
jgi:hypothetical protein